MPSILVKCIDNDYLPYSKIAEVSIDYNLLEIIPVNM